MGAIHLHEDPPISEAEANQIKILSESESSDLWVKYISKYNRHYMLLGYDEFPSGSGDTFLYYWKDDWHYRKSQKFKSKLKNLPFEKNETIIFFWMKESAIETQWSVFYNNWINFLYEDEGCILICETNPNTIILSNGLSWFLQR